MQTGWGSGLDVGPNMFYKIGANSGSIENSENRLNFGLMLVKID